VESIEVPGTVLVLGVVEVSSFGVVVVVPFVVLTSVLVLVVPSVFIPLSVPVLTPVPVVLGVVESITESAKTVDTLESNKAANSDEIVLFIIVLHFKV
jgi:hypothetical protein